MYDINYDHLIESQLPDDRRTPFWAALQKWWLSWAIILHTRARKFGKYQYQRATTTTQIGSMVATLNDIFNTTEIYITDVEWIDDVYVYLDLEPYNDVILYLDSETIDPEDEVYLYSDAEVNPTQFIVWIPASLNVPGVLTQIASQVDQHCLFGKSYTIQVIP